MSPLDNDIETLEDAVRVFVHIMKRPQRWAAIAERAKVNMDRPSAIILQTLTGASGTCRIQDLAIQLGIEPPYITRKTQELERDGYLKRVADRDDKRAVDLHVTAKGRDVADRLRKAQRETIEEVLKDWDPEERRQFVKLFQRFSSDMLAMSKEHHNPGKQGDADA